MYCCLFFFSFFSFEEQVSLCPDSWVCGPWHECFLVVDWRESFVTLSTVFLRTNNLVPDVLEDLLCTEVFNTLLGFTKPQLVRP